ncbi:MAG: cysteine dioxygenase family protein [bacterium]|nr:cysteine dioxygenase family protein [bacterium]
MVTVTIDKLVSGLREMSDEDFVCEPVYEYLSSRDVDTDSISKYMHWSSKFYTRNLIYKDERFEMMAICWDKGQVSRVHNHWDQRCWMIVPVGKLLGQNFGIEEIDESRGYCKLYETNNFELTECLAARVDLEEPIHQVLNLAEFGERAVSIHIYSKPFDRCLSYCRDTNTFKEVGLFYTSIDGELCDGIQL